MIGGDDGVSLVKVGDTIVLMIQLYPTAFMLALDADQATNLAESLLEMVVTPAQKDKIDSLIDAAMKSALKKKEDPS
jgi:hypothetical protein